MICKIKAEPEKNILVYVSRKLSTSITWADLFPSREIRNWVYVLLDTETETDECTCFNLLFLIWRVYT